MGKTERVLSWPRVRSKEGGLYSSFEPDAFPFPGRVCTTLVRAPSANVITLESSRRSLRRAGTCSPLKRTDRSELKLVRCLEFRNARQHVEKHRHLKPRRFSSLRRDRCQEPKSDWLCRLAAPLGGRALPGAIVIAASPRISRPASPRPGPSSMPLPSCGSHAASKGPLRFETDS
jgi:hypothetical protein